ncbi:MAG TPA: beta-ketoacyl-ACP synthase III [Tepidisphaeraceae bacterium]|jgi:3-oxoacyl-[acyl-carrier-protein] synthase III|nr:beta-ketoacyl-ACP synthase III [Tepidisphaeraceae bacterium]
MPLPSAIIAGTGSYLPEKRLTNDDLSKLVDTNDEWITQRTGIKERRIAGSHESTATIASHAATRALGAAGLEPKHLDLIICATITPEMTFPSTACFVAASLGLDSTPAFDITAACSGFIYSLDTAAAFIKSGQYKNVLIIGAETLSRVTDYTDRGSCILFGDGAGAAVVQQSNDANRGLLYSKLYADGHGWEMLHCIPGSRHPISESMVAGRQHFMKIKGRDVYKFAVQRFNELIEDAMRKCELTADQVKLIIPHQVNQRIIDSAMDKLKLPPEKAFVNIDKYGNTSAASIPIALDEAVRSGKLKKNDVAIFVAFGAGLTWANAVVRM